GRCNGSSSSTTCSIASASAATSASCCAARSSAVNSGRTNSSGWASTAGGAGDRLGGIWPGAVGRALECGDAGRKVVDGLGAPEGRGGDEGDEELAGEAVRGRGG